MGAYDRMKTHGFEKNRKKIKGVTSLVAKLLAVLLVMMLCVGCQELSGITEQAGGTSTDSAQQTEVNAEVRDLNGIDISEFSVVYSSTDSDYCKRAAKYICDQIKVRTGCVLSMNPDYLPAESEYEIVVGEADRDISKQLDADTQNVQFAIMADDNSIALEGDYFVIAAAAYFFIETYIPSSNFDSTVPKEATVHDPIQKEAKNYILMIGDGMGFNQTLLFEKYAKNISSYNEYSDNENIFYGYYFPSQGQSRTNSLSGVTDSAAGGTALATGYKTLNGYVGKDKTGKNIESLTELAGRLGKATAVISTDSATGATPSSFSAHALDRDDSDGIKASQTVLVKNYDTAIYCGQNKYDSSGVKTLEGAVKATLKSLAKNENGFFMMYEEAHIDKWCHSNDMDNTFNSVVRFNQIIGIVMEYAFYNPDTFVLITADHETGGLSKASNGSFSYSQTSHSGANVPVFAYGMGAEVFNGLTVENTQIPKTIASMMGVKDFGAKDNYKSLLD